MIKLDEMLMIGSSQSNVGKTKLGCAILNKYSTTNNIVAIKVTTMDKTELKVNCSKEDYDFDSFLKNGFSITEERNISSEKDTARFLKAGASKVFLLRAIKENLNDGLNTLLKRIDSGTISLCESTSLRKIIEPGIFLLVANDDLASWKDSALQVKDYADKIVINKAGNINLKLEQIQLIDNKWVLLEKATAIILAGGNSKRMGIDKSMLNINGKPMIEYIYSKLRNIFSQVLISANDIKKYSFLGVPVIPDAVSEQGPIIGLASALESSANELNFVIACDIPIEKLLLIRKLMSEAENCKADIVVPITKDQQSQPLFAVYRKTALKAINTVLSRGNRRIHDVFELCKTKYIQLETGLPNLNTLKEFREFEKVNVK